MDFTKWFEALDIGFIVGVLGILQLVKETLLYKKIELPSVVYRWGSVLFGALASLILPLASDAPVAASWRELGTRAFVYAGATLITYNLIKDPAAFFRKLLKKKETVIGKRLS